MAVYRNDIVNIELNGGSIFRSFINKTVGEGDKNGNRFGVRLFRNGEPENIEGSTVTGYFIRSNGTTVIMGGSAAGNVATVELPESCYSVEGNFSLAIKITGGNATGTMRIVDGTVVNTVIGEILDPSGIIPDLEELMAVIERAEEAAEAIAEFAITEQLISGDNYRLIVNVEGGS